jgi:hypothetical protein
MSEVEIRAYSAPSPWFKLKSGTIVNTNHIYCVEAVTSHLDTFSFRIYSVDGGIINVTGKTKEEAEQSRSELLKNLGIE